MKRAFSNKILLFIFTISALLSTCGISTAQSVNSEKNINIGILIDVNKSEMMEGVNLLRKELNSLLGTKYNISIPDYAIIESGWSEESLRRNFTKLQNDKRVDMIVSIGALTGSVLPKVKIYKKPLIVIGIIDPAYQGTPITPSGSSGVKNFTYLYTPFSVESDISKFHDLINFSKVGIISDKNIFKLIPDKRLIGKSLKDKANYKMILVEDTLSDAVSKISDDIDAIYYSGLYKFSTKERKELFNKINNLGLPTYSLMGEENVKLGVLAGTAPEANFTKILRRIAITVERILDGDDPANLPVSISYKEKLYLNMRTARKINFSPSWDILAKAELIEEGVVETSRVLDLLDIVNEALKENLSLQAEKISVDTSKDNLKIARAKLLPGLTVSSTGVLIDEDTASLGARSGSVAEKTVNGEATLSQVIFSEEANANLAISKLSVLSSSEDYNKIRLDVIKNSGTAYFNILRAKTVLRIKSEFLKKTRQNLDIAKQRRRVGYSGVSDVYRWESELANAKSGIVDAKRNLKQAKASLNQLLNRPIDEHFTVKDAKLTDSIFIRQGSQKINDYITNPKSLKIFTDFLVREAMDTLPEIKSLDASIKKQKRQLISLKRVRYIPTFGLSSTGTYTFDREGIGARATDNTKEDFEWNVALSASLPLIEGGAIRTRAAKAGKELKGLEKQRRDIINQLELSVRTKLMDLEVKAADLEFSKQSANFAAKSLKLTRDAYSKGTVSIVQLLDARNNSIAANQAAANSVYEYFISMLDTERAVGGFSFLKSPDEQKKFFNKFEQYIRKTNNS